MTVAGAMITIDAEPTLLRVLGEIRDEQRRCREALECLVTMEEERRAAERQMEELARALVPGAGMEAGGDLEALDFYRTASGEFRVRDAGRDRAPTAAEAVALRGTVAPRERRRR